MPARVPRISIIIICRNERQDLATLLPQLAAVASVEIIVSDGESVDGTEDLADHYHCRYIRTQPGRGRQLNAGARAASGDILLFLHADCRLENGWERELRSELLDPSVVGGAFSLRMCGGRLWWDRILSWTGTRNARRCQIFLGDHSIFVRRDVFETVGGFPEMDIMEDYYFSKILRDAGRLVQLKSASLSSSRRFVENGYLKTILQMRLLRLFGALGWSSPHLERWYLRTKAPAVAKRLSSGDHSL
jgi:rSAM/selenodomain-associated transferase 2